MNLHGIAGAYVSAVNPAVACSVQISTGTTTDSSYKRSPSYAAPITVEGQVQPMTYRDLQQVDALNLQGTKRSIYLTGNVQGLVRKDNKGGDLITMPNGDVWLVVMVLEDWLHDAGDPNEPGWVKVAAVLQNPLPN